MIFYARLALNTEQFNGAVALFKINHMALKKADLLSNPIFVLFIIMVFTKGYEFFNPDRTWTF